MVRRQLGLTPDRLPEIDILHGLKSEIPTALGHELRNLSVVSGAQRLPSVAPIPHRTPWANRWRDSLIVPSRHPGRYKGSQGR